MGALPWLLKLPLTQTRSSRLEAFDEKPAVPSHVGDLRGASVHTGGGPAKGLGCGHARRRHRAPAGATHHKPKHLPVGTRNQPTAAADAGRLRHSAEVRAA